jgi:hypothetical protein
MYQSGQRPQSEIYIRMVLPSEQITAIAKCMLERQAKPNDVSTIGQKEIQPTSEKRERQNSQLSDTTRKSKTPRLNLPSTGRKPTENKAQLENIAIIGQVLN